MIELLLECRDHIELLIAAVAGGESSEGGELSTRGEELGLRLRGYLPGDPRPSSEPVALPEPAALEGTDTGSVASDTWHISIASAPARTRSSTLSTR